MADNVHAAYVAYVFGVGAPYVKGFCVQYAILLDAAICTFVNVPHLRPLKALQFHHRYLASLQKLSAVKMRSSCIIISYDSYLYM